MSTTYRNRCDETLTAMYTIRTSWLEHWRELARNILPRRFRYLATPNEQRGNFINNKIIDSTATIASRVLSAGMMSGITSPSRPWFKFRIEGFDVEDTHPVALWLAEVERRMMVVLHKSNFYNSIATVYQDLAVFGSATMLIYEDFEEVIRCFNPVLGEFYFDNDDRLAVGVFGREFVMNVRQIAERWGEESLPESLKPLYKEAAGKLQEVIVGHLIEPNTGESPVPRDWPWRETYWVRGYNGRRGADLSKDDTIENRGFFEKPGIFPRWDVASNDPYGRSPGMDALGDVKQLQQETLRKAQAIDKMVNPPMVADVQLKNQPASTLPGGVTYINGIISGQNRGFAPAYEVQPRIQEMMLDIQEIQQRIKSIFFNDLFLLFQNLQTEPRSATIVDARREEKLIMLGPVLERFHNEALDPALARTYAIMSRARMIPPPPPEIANRPIMIEYVSILAQAQRAVGTVGIERVLGLAGNLAAVRPDVLDNVDFDFSVREYSTLLGNNPKMLRDPNEVFEERQQRQQAQNAAVAAEAAIAGVEAAKTLSETETGAGRNALQQMLSGGL